MSPDVTATHDARTDLVYGGQGARLGPLLPVGEHNAGRLLGHGLEVPGDEAAVGRAAHELLALVVPAEAGELLGALVHLLLFLGAQVPQCDEATAKSNQKFGWIRRIFWGFKARHQPSLSTLTFVYIYPQCEARDPDDGRLRRRLPCSS